MRQQLSLVGAGQDVGPGGASLPHAAHRAHRTVLQRHQRQPHQLLPAAAARVTLRSELETGEADTESWLSSKTDVPGWSEGTHLLQASVGQAEAEQVQRQARHCLDLQAHIQSIRHEPASSEGGAVASCCFLFTSCAVSGLSVCCTPSFSRRRSSCGVTSLIGALACFISWATR